MVCTLRHSTDEIVDEGFRRLGRIEVRFVEKGKYVYDIGLIINLPRILLRRFDNRPSHPCELSLLLQFEEYSGVAILPDVVSVSVRQPRQSVILNEVFVRFVYHIGIIYYNYSDVHSRARIYKA